MAVTLDEVEAAGAKYVPDMEESSEDEAMAVDEVDVEAWEPKEDTEAEVEEQTRAPNTKRAPVGMTPAEWQVHRLTHLPYNPAC